MADERLQSKPGANRRKGTHALAPNAFKVSAIQRRLAEALVLWRSDWNVFIRDVLQVRLDPVQQAIVSAVQHNRRTTVRSGHARGKDFTAACVSVAFLFLRSPCKVIETAPTGRQVGSIMMAEIKGLWKQAIADLGGEVLSMQIRFPQNPNWFLEGFKAADKSVEAWTGYHSPNLLVVVTEASGIQDETFQAIEGLLTGDSRLMIVGNPNRNSGEFYQSYRSAQYKQFVLSCLDAPNVLAKKTVIPGQVDWEWVNEKVHKAGWCTQIRREEMMADEGDFEWEGLCYRPTDLFRVKVLGMFPKADSAQLIPLPWIEAAESRWKFWHQRGRQRMGDLRLGVDVAGMGADATVLLQRCGNVVEGIDAYTQSDHMATAGRVKNGLQKGGHGYIDTIGEGAGVYSRCKEEGQPVTGVKFSEAAVNRRGKPYTDRTGEREFLNMRAYCYWALRDALDPGLEGNLCLPPDDDLKEELTAITYDVRGNGLIFIRPKDEIRSALGRSPDRADALALTYYPKGQGGLVIEASKHNWRNLR